MKEVKFYCDCCRREMHTSLTVNMPIIMNSFDPVDGSCEKTIRAHEMDICRDCANKLATEYYKIANENNNTGIIGVEE